MRREYKYACLAGRTTMPDKDTLETLAPVAAQLAAEEEQKQNNSLSVVDGVDFAANVLDGVVDIGGAVIEGIGQVGSAVAENAGGVAEAAVEVVGTVVGGLLEL
jgi:hypothetical protein